jgi:hypothetical protein
MTEEELMLAYRNAPRDPFRLPDREVDQRSGGFTRRDASIGTSVFPPSGDGGLSELRVSDDAPEVLRPGGVSVSPEEPH